MKRKSGMVLGVLAGLATCAQAQSLSVHVSFDRDAIVPGQSAVATMTASFTTLSGDPDSYFTAIDIDLIATSQAYTASNLVFGSWHQDGTSNPPAGPTGEFDGASILDLGMTQSSFVGNVDTSHQLFIASWTVTNFSLDGLTYRAYPTVSDAFAVIDQGIGPFGSVDRYGTDVFTSDTLRQAPSPGSLGVFGMGLVFAGRRRR